MELRKGYKQTEVGVIPEDWYVKNIADIVQVDPENLASSTNPNYGFKYISLEDVDNGILRNISEIIFSNAPSRARRKVKKDDILISTVRPNLKSHLLIKEEVKDWICSTGFSVLRSNPDINISFLFNHFFASIINRQIENLITGSNYPAINSKEVKALQIPLPPTKAEQTAIATALSDMDDLIKNLSTLIEKKKAIKQGAMQQLLKPKEGWVVKKLGEVGNCYAGGTPSTFNSAYWSGNIVWLPSGRVQNNILVKQENEITITELGLKESAAKLIKVNSVLIAITGATCGNIGLLQFEAAANQSVVAIEPFDKYDYKYLYYLLLTIRGIILSNQTGSAQGGVNLKTIKNIEIELPEDEKEQIKISTILYDMDNEISALEQNLSKYQMLKQGMMQELLTGKTRLI